MSSHASPSQTGTSILFGFILSQPLCTTEHPATLNNTMIQANAIGSSEISANSIGSVAIAANAIGSFTANGTNLGINSGIIMTTGTVLNTPAGPHGPNNAEGAGTDNGVGGDGQLSSIVGASTYNAAILEFDFETCSDTVQFAFIVPIRFHCSDTVHCSDTIQFKVQKGVKMNPQVVPKIAASDLPAIESSHNQGSLPCVLKAKFFHTYHKVLL